MEFQTPFYFISAICPTIYNQLFILPIVSPCNGIYKEDNQRTEKIQTIDWMDSFNNRGS